MVKSTGGKKIIQAKKIMARQRPWCGVVLGLNQLSKFRESRLYRSNHLTEPVTRLLQPVLFIPISTMAYNDLSENTFVLTSI